MIFKKLQAQAQKRSISTTECSKTSPVTFSNFSPPQQPPQSTEECFTKSGL